MGACVNILYTFILVNLSKISSLNLKKPTVKIIIQYFKNIVNNIIRLISRFYSPKQDSLI